MLSTTARTSDNYLRSWRWSLRAAGRSPRTVETYMEAGEQLLANVSDPTTATRADVAGYLLSLSERSCKPATVSVRFRALQQFFKWLVEEGGRQDDPMAGMRPPKVTEVPVEVLSVADVRRLLAVCSGTDLVARRDTAILRLFADTGMRREELANLRVDDVDLD